jgi:hypothetical protein
MGVYEERGAGAVPAKNFDEPAVAGLRHAAAAESLGKACAKDAKFSETFDDILRYVFIAIDGDGIDRRVTVGREICHPLVEIWICKNVWIGRQRFAVVSSKIKTFGEPKLFCRGSKQLFCLGYLLISIDFLHSSTRLLPCEETFLNRWHATSDRVPIA